ncbi:ATPase family AAA domain-containing protein 5b isoform X2 [Sphaeramia orbicularis]|uniref:ATPase family AAA domain-containing protein 5b isoform X2 n=1 Tax=Sphaeramia orbicularis TaxID=375764 RepID=UPI00117C490F|nr:ATPase family AAA domain-containing protein 5-like isoform X2 [Sphaeramia orbicularis]
MNVENSVMRNKLKLNKKCKDGAYPREDKTQETEVVVPSSKHSENNKYDANTVYPQQELRKTCRTEDTKIAPIFLCSSQFRKSKKTSDGKLDLYVDKPKKQVLPSENSHLQHVKNEPSSNPVCHLSESDTVGTHVSTWRAKLSSSALHSCLQEIQTSKPTFVVQKVFNTLQKKTSQSLHDIASTVKYPSYTSSLPSLHNHFKEKRKRDHESLENVSKRLKPSITAEVNVSTDEFHTLPEGVQNSPVLSVKKQPTSRRLSRTHRLKCGSGRVHLVNNCESDSELMNHSKSETVSPNASDFQREFSYENVPWTEKYSPQHSTEVIGNSTAVHKLHSWLKKWKLRADCDDRRKFEEKQHEKSNDSWDCGDFQNEVGSEDTREEPLCNTMLITGPPGVGKTASVYACAVELGFKVFEVNCSSQRNGRQVLYQLKEATQSHLVETSGKDSLKPAFFSNFNTSSCPAKPDSLPAKTVVSRNVISTSKKKPSQNRRGKANPATATLTNYFKMKAKADCLHWGGPSLSDKPDSKTFNEPSPDSDQTVPQNKKAATSLILFEEVDVIFDDDVGFLIAIKTFMTTTKRPVILTTNDHLFRERFNCSLEEIVFKPLSVADVCSYLQLVCLTENVKLDLDDVISLFRLTRGDIRRCLLQLQFWANSSRGLSKDPRGCSGCTANMLGLQTVTQNNLLQLLDQLWTEAQMSKFLKPLLESWRTAVPLLYSNLELLLFKDRPILVKATFPGPHIELAAPNTHVDTKKLEGNVCQQPTLPSSNSVKNISRLSRRKHVSIIVNGAKKTHRKSAPLSQTHQRAQSSDSNTEQRANRVEANCLGALTDLFDLMSYLDATLPAAQPLISGPCHPGESFWAGAEIRDGLLDEMAEEDVKSCSQERLLEIQAAVEGLGFHRCWQQVSEVWTEAQRCRQDSVRWSAPASSNKQKVSFSFQPLHLSSASKKRYDLNRTVLSCRPFSLMGNRQAISVDYMPVICLICRSHKEQKQQKKDDTERCLKYFSHLDVGLSRSTLRLLVEDVSLR